MVQCVASILVEMGLLEVVIFKVDTDLPTGESFDNKCAGAQSWLDPPSLLPVCYLRSWREDVGQLGIYLLAQLDDGPWSLGCLSKLL